MAISGDYPKPINVNGYPCHNCSEVAQAKRYIDPAHPQSGPFGVDAASDPTARGGKGQAQEAAVSFGGALSGLNSRTTTEPSANENSIGGRYDRTA